MANLLTANFLALSEFIDSSLVVAIVAWFRNALWAYAYVCVCGLQLWICMCMCMCGMHMTFYERHKKHCVKAWDQKDTKQQLIGKGFIWIWLHRYSFDLSKLFCIFLGLYLIFKSLMCSIFKWFLLVFLEEVLAIFFESNVRIMLFFYKFLILKMRNDLVDILKRYV